MQKNKKVFESESLREKFFNLVGLCSYFTPSMENEGYVTDNEFCLFDSKAENYLSRRKFEDARGKSKRGGMDMGSESIRLSDSYKTFLDELLNDLWDKDVLVHFELMGNCDCSGLTPIEFAEKFHKGDAEAGLRQKYSTGIKYASSNDSNFSLFDIANSVTKYVGRFSDSAS